MPSYLASQIKVDDAAGVDEAEVKAINLHLARVPALVRDYAEKHNSTATLRTLEAAYKIDEDVFQLEPDAAEALYVSIHAALSNGTIHVAANGIGASAPAAALPSGGHGTASSDDTEELARYKRLFGKLANSLGFVPQPLTSDLALDNLLTEFKDAVNRKTDAAEETGKKNAERAATAAPSGFVETSKVKDEIKKRAKTFIKVQKDVEDEKIEPKGFLGLKDKLKDAAKPDLESVLEYVDGL